MKKSIFTILCSALFIQFAYSQQVYFDYDNSGNRIYRYTLEVGNKSGTVSNTDSDTTTLREDAGGFEFVLFPNPTQKEVRITAESEFLERQGNVLYVYDLNGKLLMQQNFVNRQELLDFSNMPSGTYLIKLWSENGWIAEWKVVKR
jgi:hypothetical protein